VLTAERILLGGFVTIALNLMKGIDAFTVAGLVIMLAASVLALDSFITPTLMSTPTSLGGARRRCALGTGVLRLSELL
jgi:hypothetical protein